MRGTLPLVFVLVALRGACGKRSAGPTVGSVDASEMTPTATWFSEHRKDVETVRAMLAADHGLVTDLGLGPLGGLHSAGGRKGSCGSHLRGNTFPWTCTGDVVAKDLSEVEAFLGVPKGRLDAYARVLPAKQVGSGEPCAPPGSLLFWLEDADSSPCTGISNVVWSPVTPVVKTDGTCQRTVKTHYVPLGGGYYEDACVVMVKTN